MFNSYILMFLTLYLLSYFYYVKISKGLGHKAEYLQLRRFFPCAVLAVLPMYLLSVPLNYPPYIISLITGALWIIIYPLFYYLTYHKTSSDFGFHLDTVFGLYIISWLVSLKLLVQYFNFWPAISLFIISCIEFIIILIPIIQILYYAVYKTCVTDSSIMLMRETDHNEAIEFYKSLPFIIQIIIPVILIAVFSAINYGNQTTLPQISSIYDYSIYIIIATTLFLTYYLWNTKKGVFIRTGIIELFLDVNKYIKETHLYASNLETRLKNLKVTPNKPNFDKPSTIIMIIGESESRDYMSAFTDYQYNTTPWLKEMSLTKNFVLFPNSYACKDQTVPALERVLTEVNQYNDKKFYESCSIIDITKKAGYKTYWFSNQGHIGSAETAITLVANTADKAEWTKQNLNKPQYDETLLDYIKTVNPDENNFIVLHLMGNHFNFINRYPQNFAKFSKPDKYDLIPNYLDSIAYTDYVLQTITEYAKTNLNLQVLLYFSDHATIPDKRRSPNFAGFGTVRIPMFLYLSDEYIAKNSEIYTDICNNSKKYFTNDLIYEFICGILNIKSNHYDETNSIASSKYKYTKEMLKTNLGELWIKDDNKNILKVY